jgi:hypothetical protein
MNRKQLKMTSASLGEIPLDGLSRICSTYICHRPTPIPRDTTTRSIGWQWAHLVVASEHACWISGGAFDVPDSRPRGASAHDASNPARTATSGAARCAQPMWDVLTTVGT